MRGGLMSRWAPQRAVGADRLSAEGVERVLVGGPVWRWKDLQREAAELRVQLMNEQDTTRGLRDTVRDQQDELTATHEIARGYLRELDQAKADLRTTRQELMKLRTPPDVRKHPNRHAAPPRAEPHDVRPAHGST